MTCTNATISGTIQVVILLVITISVVLFQVLLLVVVSQSGAEYDLTN